MSLVQYGVTNDSRVILSLKDADSNAASPAAVIAAGCSKQQPDLSSELMMLLLRHFTPADAERVAAEFNQVTVLSSYHMYSSENCWQIATNYTSKMNKDQIKF